MASITYLPALRTLATIILLLNLAITCTSQSASLPASARNNPDQPAALTVLTRLRTLRDCWRDPYMVILGDDPKLENDTLYLRCGSDYLFHFDALQKSVSHALASIDGAKSRAEIIAAIRVFNDLDSLHNLFNSRAYYVLRDIRTADVAPILRKYNINHREKTISKVSLYRAIIPHRRLHIDRLTSLIAGAPRDTNPTLTPLQAAAAADDLEWSFVTKQQQGYDWYLRRHPRGLHVAEARDLIGRQGEIRQEQEARLTKTRDELASVTKDVIKAYVRGDKATFDRLLASSFPSRAIYLAQLRAQSNVLSFEIKNFDLRPSPTNPQGFRAKMDVQYRSLLNQQSREFHNTITYQKSNGTWQIIDWHSP